MLSTVWHSGTHSAKAELRKKGIEAYMIHCCWDALMKLETDPRFTGIVSTRRDPLRVAASWANRGEAIDYRWFEQWGVWSEMIKKHDVEIIKPTERLNTSDDTLHLHRYLDDNDMESYYQHVPKDAIDYANG